MHSHHHSHTRATRGLQTAFFINLVFTLVEVVGGIWTNSIAVLSDAVHDAGDCLSLGLAWYLERISAQRPNTRFTYGKRRFSVLGGLITGTVLLVGIGFVVTHAFQRLLDPQPVHAPGMVALATLGIIGNGAAVLRLRGRKGLNASIVSWHLLEDVLGWVAVLIGSVIMVFWELPVIDPILSIGISGFILYNVGRNLKRVVLVFLQGSPPDFDVAGFESAVRELPGIESTHHTHSWSIDGENHVFSVHLVFRAGTGPGRMQETKRRVRELLAPHGFEHTTIETELEGEPCAVPEATT